MWGATCTATSALVGSAAERHAERHAGCHAERHSERLSELHPPLPHSSGGGTRFNMLGIQVIPRKGTALIFFPTFTDGTIDTNSLHEALPAEERKFVCQARAVRASVSCPTERLASASQVSASLRGACFVAGVDPGARAARRPRRGEERDGPSAARSAPRAELTPDQLVATPWL